MLLKVSTRVENINNQLAHAHKLYLKKKKTAHAYYERSYFSKSFGGKIETVQTDVTKEKNIPKKINKIIFRKFDFTNSSKWQKLLYFDYSFILFIAINFRFDSLD